VEWDQEAVVARQGFGGFATNSAANLTTYEDPFKDLLLGKDLSTRRAAPGE
jgi:hypothetical protein